MKKIGYAIAIMCFTISCTQETKILKLEKHSGNGTYDREEDSTKIFYYQSALVSNVPENQDQIKSKLFDFHKKSLDTIFLKKDVVSFRTTFYLKNFTTSYFIDNDDDPGGFSSEILSDYYEKYGIAEIQSSRQKESSKIKNEITFANSDKVILIE